MSMRNKNAASVADNDDLLDPLRRAVARCTRAVARKKNLEIVFDAGRPTADANLVVLPPRQYLMGAPFTTLNPPVLMLWRPLIGENVDALMQRLGPVVEDQAAFAAVARKLVAELRQQTVPAAAVAEPIEDEQEAQGEQEPGPIEGGDRSLGPAEGHKSAKDEAIGDEPIYGTAEKAAAPGNDSLAERLAIDQHDYSSPS